MYCRLLYSVCIGPTACLHRYLVPIIAGTNTAFYLMILLPIQLYDITNRLKIPIFPIRLHSASSLQILRSTARFNTLLPTVNVSPLKLYSVSSINLYGASNYNIFRNHLRIRLSPIKSPILLKYKNPYKRNSIYTNISKCNAKSCTCCNHLICQSTIISSVNHRQFSVVNHSDLD